MHTDISAQLRAGEPEIRVGRVVRATVLPISFSSWIIDSGINRTRNTDGSHEKPALLEIKQYMLFTAFHDIFPHQLVGGGPGLTGPTLAFLRPTPEGGSDLPKAVRGSGSTHLR